MTNARYLWFAPHAGLWPSFRLEHRLAEAMARDGRDVTMIHCRGVLSDFCPVMAAEKLTPDSPTSAKKRICADCRHNVGLVGEVASYRQAWLDDLVTTEMRGIADQFARSATPNNWQDLELAGLPIGRWSGYLTLLHHKVPDVTSSPAAWREYVSDLRDAALVAKATPAMLACYEPTHAVVYNPLYPTTRMFTEIAVAAGVQLVNVAAGAFIPGRYETVGVYPSIKGSQTVTDSQSIAQSLREPVTDLESRVVTAHIGELIRGADPWVYSSAPTRVPPAEVRRELGLRPDAPVVVVLVSSPDETRSSMLVEAEYMRDPQAGYSDIPEFLNACTRAAEALPGADWVFRLHPRLLPNKRDHLTSPDLERISQLLEGLPSNAVVNAPVDGLSLYDIVTIASAAVNQSSSAGLEFLTLGLPVVQYDPPRLGAYSRDFTELVPRGDVEALTTAVERVLEEGWSIEHTRDAYRWYTTVLLRALLHLAPLEESYATSSEVPPQESREAEAAPPLPLKVARAVLPEAVRERAARRMARNSRSSTVPNAAEDEAWRGEWLDRLDQVQGREEIWEPLIIRRGDTGPVDETAVLQRELSTLLLRLGIHRGAGLGALEGALPAGR